MMKIVINTYNHTYVLHIYLLIYKFICYTVECLICLIYDYNPRLYVSGVAEFK